MFFIMHFLHSFTAVYCKKLCNHVCYRKIIIKTLIKYVVILSKKVGNSIKAIVTDRIDLFFDRQKLLGAHYVRIFAELSGGKQM